MTGTIVVVNLVDDGGGVKVEEKISSTSENESFSSSSLGCRGGGPP